MFAVFRFGYGTHHQVRAVQFVARCAVRVVCYCDSDVVEWTHERSERWYRCRNEGPGKPYLDPDGWGYVGQTLVFCVDCARKMAFVYDRKSDNTVYGQTRQPRRTRESTHASLKANAVITSIFGRLPIITPDTRYEGMAISATSVMISKTVIACHRGIWCCISDESANRIAALTYASQLSACEKK